MMKALPLAVNDQPGSVQGPVCRRQSLLLLPWSKKKIKNKNRPSIGRICLCRGFTAGEGKGSCFLKVPVLKRRSLNAGTVAPAEAQEWACAHGPHRVHLQYS